MTPPNVTKKVLSKRQVEKGWAVSTVQDFLGLTDEEVEEIERRMRDEDRRKEDA